MKVHQPTSEQSEKWWGEVASLPSDREEIVARENANAERRPEVLCDFDHKSGIDGEDPGKDESLEDVLKDI